MKVMKMKMIKVLCGLMTFCVISAFTGCASNPNLTAPCPKFGEHCAKVPINSWDNQSS